HWEAEEAVGAELEAVGPTRGGGVKERARRRVRHPRAFSERAAGAAGVHEPAVPAVLVELASEHVRVHGRPLREEGRAEARREGRLRLGDTDLRAGELR